MPETENASSDPTSRSRASAGPGARSQASASAGSQERGINAVKEHIARHKIDFVLAITRVLTVLCTISYLIGFPGPANNRYKQALLMTAATSLLRLHQRMPPPPMDQLGWTYFMDLVREDSFHYLIFPFMFYAGHNLTLALLPCSLYALFNLAVYSITILDKLGNQDQLKVKIAAMIAKYQQSLLHTVALSEVTLMAMVIVGVFTRSVWFLTPMFYYRFLLLRYNSTRNAHLKVLVSQITTFARTQAARYMNR